MKNIAAMQSIALKRILFVAALVVVTLAVISCAPVAAPTAAPPTSAPPAQATSAPPAQATEAPAAAAAGQEYTVAQGDTLAALAEKNLGNKDLLWAIYGLTNAKHIADASYAQITHPDQGEPGGKIYIPNQAEAAAFMEKFYLANPDITMLFPKPAGGQLLGGNWWTSCGEFAGING